MSDSDDYFKDILERNRRLQPEIQLHKHDFDEPGDKLEQPEIFHPAIQSFLERAEVIDEGIRKYRLDATPNELKAIKRFRYELEDVCRNAKLINDQIYQIEKAGSSEYSTEAAHGYIEKQIDKLNAYLADLAQEGKLIKSAIRKNSLPTNPNLSLAKPSQKKKLFSKDNMNYVLGWTLVSAALVDGIFDPFKVLTAPALLYSGLALLGVDKVSGKRE
ncbi:hypothetical protein Lepto7375DRAFT_0927 [Leptolyngbya sp. PCC 7375]|nr:hypothetical protein Lepto7375DRAFT_0927 [Leptolyngbya sp. PCC 7375]